MSDEKKKVVPNGEDKLKDKELSLDELKDVSGGALKDVSFTKTTEISKDTQEKI